MKPTTKIIATLLFACLAVAGCNKQNDVTAADQKISSSGDTPDYLKKSISNSPKCASSPAGCNKEDWDEWHKSHPSN